MKDFLLLKNKYKTYIELAFYLIIFIPISLFLFFRVENFIYIWLNVSADHILLGIIIVTILSALLYYSYKYNFFSNIMKISTRVNLSYTLMFPLILILGLLTSSILGRRLLENSVGQYDLSIHPRLIKIADFGSSIIFIIYMLVILSCIIYILKGYNLPLVIFKNNYTGILLFAFIINAITVIYLANSHWIYFWDTTGYWDTSTNLSRLLFGNITIYLKEVYNSIINYDYNYLAAIPLSILAKVFGTSRYIYILSIQNIYLIPSVILLYLFGGFVKRETQSSIPQILLFTVTILFLPYIFFIGLVGFVDIGGLFIMIACILLYLRNDYRKITRYFIIGNLLTLLYVFRRWYIFWVVSFIICQLIYSVLSNLKFKKHVIKNIFFDILSSCATIVGTAFTLLFFLQPLVISKLLMGNYSDSYSAYDLGIRYDYFSFIRYFGVIIFVLIFISVVYLCINKSTRKYPLFLLTQSILCFILFRRIQSHGQQHFLLYVPTIAIILMVFFNSLIKNQHSIIKQKIIIFLILLFGIINTSITFFDTGYNPEKPNQVNKSSFFPNFKLLPRSRYDIPEILRIANYLDNLSENRTKKIAVLASSLDINTEIIGNVEKSINIPTTNNLSRNYFLSCPAVDKRDGFPYSLFLSDYVVVADPIQYHLDIDDQKVVVIPAYSFLHNQDIAKAFIKLDITFRIRNNIKIYVYKKVREISVDEKRELVGKLYNCYPDKPNLFPAPETIN